MYAKVAVEFFLANGKSIINTIFGGVCERFPTLKFVSVESGIGWIPFLVEAMDWQWLNGGCPKAHPEIPLLPSDYFRRQFYACFWFEDASAISAIKSFGADNFMFETDFPHPTSLSPGPTSHARNPREHIELVLRDQLSPEELQKVHDNAARLYGLT
jgi:predicted TIM-barrel fold metal-dependent hydrolase